MLNGVTFVDKPEGFTSHDVVAKLRRLLGTKKIGHAGTLDPMATGLLTLGVGPSTRLLTYMVGLDKTYEATIRLGQATITDDRESDFTKTAPVELVERTSDEQIYEEIAKLTGKIEQKPSSVSAIKVAGRRAYDLVRDGEKVELKARPVTIHSFEVKKITRIEIENSTAPDGSTKVIDVEVVVECSSGTYIRALARDLGDSLQLGGHLTQLRRTKVGLFDVSAAVSLDEIATDDIANEDIATETLITAPQKIAQQLFATLTLNEQQSKELLQGKRFKVETEDTELIAALSPNGKLLGLVKVVNGLIKTITNFPQEEL